MAQPSDHLSSLGLLDALNQNPDDSYYYRVYRRQDAEFSGCPKLSVRKPRGQRACDTQPPASQHRIGQQQLQLGVLVLQRLQPRGLGGRFAVGMPASCSLIILRISASVKRFFRTDLLLQGGAGSTSQRGNFRGAGQFLDRQPKGH